MILGTTLGIIYIVLLIVFGILCFRKGHWVLGLIGIIFPILWIIGAILPSRYVRRWRGASPREARRTGGGRCHDRGSWATETAA
jgi:hypothetical protein